MTTRTLGSRLLLWANVLAANIAALVCVITFVSPATLNLGAVTTVGPADGLSREQSALVLPLGTLAAWVVFAVALGLLLTELLWFLRRGRRPKEPLRYVVSDAPGGAVRVSCDALEAGLRGAGEALPEITRVRVQVVPRPHGGPAGLGRRVRVLAWFNSPDGLSNLEASRLLRRALEARFAAMVQLPDGVRVEFEIEFMGFAGKLAKRAEEPEAPAAPPEEEQAPFTGPRYPIEDDDQ